MLKLIPFLVVLMFTSSAAAQSPPIEPGVSHELAKWRAAHYSDVRYKLNLTLEKMSPVLKGTIEIRVKVSDGKPNGPVVSPGGFQILDSMPTIVLDWRKIKGKEELSRISNISVNGRPVVLNPEQSAFGTVVDTREKREYFEFNEHLLFSDGVMIGENVIKLDFTSPILPSGSAITRYVDKEDGAEYIYSLFVPSDASTAFPVFDQPDLKGRFELRVYAPEDWKIVTNSAENIFAVYDGQYARGTKIIFPKAFKETQPISTYVFAFAAGPWEAVSVPPAVAGGSTQPGSNAAINDGGNATISERAAAQPNKTRGARKDNVQPPATAGGTDLATRVFVRKSQAEKFKPHAAEVFRLNREGVKFLEEYFDYKFPFPKYDIVLIPEFPFGGMEHAGSTFLREDRVIFPTEPTKNDYVTRANVIFHEAAHQWFGDTVTMRWFDDLWLKEGFAEFMAYKTLEKVMPEYNAWKIFYERNKQAAYLTDSTKGTTPIYQEISNLSAAKSAYGNIVYRKAPSFLKQAEFYIGSDKFQTAVRAFLKKHEFGNAGWEDLVKEFETSSNRPVLDLANTWILQEGLPIIRSKQTKVGNRVQIAIQAEDPWKQGRVWGQKTRGLIRDTELRNFEITTDINFRFSDKTMFGLFTEFEQSHIDTGFQFVFPNYHDYGYGIFLLDDKSRDYVLKNIQNERDDFLRTMMWGSLWDSVREAELDPKEYVELVLRVLSPGLSRPDAGKKPREGVTQSVETDESTIQTLLGRVSTAMTYYMSEPPASVGGGGLENRARRGDRSGALPSADADGSDLRARVEKLLIDGMRNAPTAGQRITYYRAFVNSASTERGRSVLKDMLRQAGGNTSGEQLSARATLPTDRVPASTAAVHVGSPDVNNGSTGANGDAEVKPSLTVRPLHLKTRDKFDIVTRLLILGDPDAPKLLADLEKTETSDEAKRYAYAAKAGIATTENKAKFWNDFVSNKEISESWIEAAFGPFNSVRHADLTLPYLERALKELPNHKRNRKIFFVNGWLNAFIGGQRSEEALAVVNTFLADNPDLDKDLRLKILENVDVIERAVKIRKHFR